MTAVAYIAFIVLVTLGSILMADDGAEALGLLTWTSGVLCGVIGVSS